MSELDAALLRWRRLRHAADMQAWAESLGPEQMNFLRMIRDGVEAGAVSLDLTTIRAAVDAVGKVTEKPQGFSLWPRTMSKKL